MEVSENPGLCKDTSDPTLFCTAYKKNRFYLFTRKEPADVKRYGTVSACVSYMYVYSTVMYMYLA